jgi:hypothetical protein
LVWSEHYFWEGFTAVGSVQWRPFSDPSTSSIKTKTEEVKDTNHLQEQCIQMDYTFSLPFAYGGSESF